MPDSDSEKPLRLNCVIFGDAGEDIFCIEVAQNANVATLIKLICEHVEPRLDAFPARKLKLFKVNMSQSEVEGPSPGNSKHRIERAVENNQSLSSFRLMSNIFKSTFRADRLHIIVQPPADAQDTIVKKLRNHGPLFELLQVRVSGFGLWSDQDVQRNMNGGEIFAPNHPRLPVEFAKMEEKLVQMRTYARPSGQDWWPGFCIASDPVHAQIFHEIYTERNDPSVSVKDDREFLAFSHILERHQEDLNNLSSKGSSSMKASHFTVRFIVPPLFCTFREYTYKEQTSLRFPIFLAEESRLRVLCKWIPTPNFIVTSNSSNCPFITSEVVSGREESGRRRALLQAIAFARAGQHLMKTGEQFFVVAIYLGVNMTAERYMVAQIGNDNKVFMCRKNFNLCLPNESVSFLREMYNLATELKELEGNFDPGKMTSLGAINNLARHLPSLTEMKKYEKANDLMRGAPAEAKPGGTADGPSVFDADDVQEILEEMECKIKFIPFGYPLVAVVSSVTDNSKTGFLKFVPDGGDEIEILKYLSGVDSPRNHTIAGVRSWPVSGGHIISMPAAGSWITHLRGPDAQLWSVAAQLVEAVDFMHRHGVAHLDLKPANILIPLGGGRLSIIDFNASERVEGVETTLGGVVGTRGYIAPEAAAGHGVFSAIRADLWSCGKTLAELCDLCRPSADREGLLQIARALMDEDPKKRPMMSDVLKWMASYKAGGELNVSLSTSLQ